MIPFIDLHAQQKLIRDKIDKRINQVLDHGQYILGPEVKELEDKLSSFTGSNYVLCCSSGTDALLLSLLGLKIKPGEGVIVPAFTFASSAEVMPLLGAIPIFIDVKRDTFNIDPTKLSDSLRTAKDLGIPFEMLSRSVNEGFSGGEKKRYEILQMSILNPSLAILDETDSGLDVDAFKTITKGVNKIKNKNNSFLIITHYEKLLENIVPNFIHIMKEGKIIKTGDKTLAKQIEKEGFQSF